MFANPCRCCLQVQFAPVRVEVALWLLNSLLRSSRMTSICEGKQKQRQRHGTCKARPPPEVFAKSIAL
eukprot:4663075-Amphidinium_carterae.2